MRVDALKQLLSYVGLAEENCAEHTTNSYTKTTTQTAIKKPEKVSLELSRLVLSLRALNMQSQKQIARTTRRGQRI